MVPRPVPGLTAGANVVPALRAERARVWSAATKSPLWLGGWTGAQAGEARDRGEGNGRESGDCVAALHMNRPRNAPCARPT